MVWTFLAVGIVGVLLLAVALLIGDVLEGLFDLDDAFGGFLSLSGLAGFVGALGFTGAIVLALSASFAIAIVSGAVVGVAVGAGAGWLTVRLKDGSRDGDSTVRSHHLIGASGRVLHAIPDGGFGQVRVVAHGQPTTLNAKADAPLPSGCSITITAVLSPTAVLVAATESSPERK